MAITSTNSTTITNSISAIILKLNSHVCCSFLRDKAFTMRILRIVVICIRRAFLVIHTKCQSFAINGLPGKPSRGMSSSENSQLPPITAAESLPTYRKQCTSLVRIWLHQSK